MDCVVLALGDICVAMTLTFVLLVIGFVAIYPLFFVWLWRPFQIRMARRHKRYAHEKLANDLGYTFRPEEMSLKLSYGKYDRLHLDPSSSPY